MKFAKWFAIARLNPAPRLGKEAERYSPKHSPYMGLGLVIALSLSSGICSAVTDNPDGSVTFTQEEAQNLLENFQQMFADQQRAVAIFQLMQKEIDRLEKEKKEMKCS